MVKFITDSELAVLEGSGVKVIKFGSEGCEPCVRFAPTFESVAAEYADRIQFFSMAYDASCMKALRQFDVRSIPTTVVLRNGEVVERMRGNHSSEVLSLMMERHCLPF
jgi:thioredoxin-like negative regulator of GroEL